MLRRRCDADAFTSVQFESHKLYLLFIQSIDFAVTLNQFGFLRSDPLAKRDL